MFKVLAAKVELGLIEAEITDFTIKKVIDTLVTDFPMSASRSKEDPKPDDSDQTKKTDRSCSDLLFVSDGLHCKIGLQSSESSHFKVIGLRA